MTPDAAFHWLQFGAWFLTTTWLLFRIHDLRELIRNPQPVHDCLKCRRADQRLRGERQRRRPTRADLESVIEEINPAYAEVVRVREAA